MTVAAGDCVLCELEEALRSRSGEIRRELQVLNPVTEPNFNRLFQVLVEVDRDRLMLKGQLRKRGRIYVRTHRRPIEEEAMTGGWSRIRATSTRPPVRERTQPGKAVDTPMTRRGSWSRPGGRSAAQPRPKTAPGRSRPTEGRSRPLASMPAPRRSSWSGSASSREPRASCTSRSRTITSGGRFER